jgi:hypothetical protein
MSYNLFIDDLRDPSYVNDGKDYVIVRSTNEAIEIVKEKGLPGFISFDHDLGTLPNRKIDESTDFLKWLAYESDIDLTDKVPEYQIHSDNGPGRDNIKSWMDSLKKRFGIYKKTLDIN